MADQVAQTKLGLLVREYNEAFKTLTLVIRIYDFEILDRSLPSDMEGLGDCLEEAYKRQSIEILERHFRIMEIEAGRKIPEEGNPGVKIEIQAKYFLIDVQRDSWVAAGLWVPDRDEDFRNMFAYDQIVLTYAEAGQTESEAEAARNSEYGDGYAYDEPWHPSDPQPYGAKMSYPYPIWPIPDDPDDALYPHPGFPPGGSPILSLVYYEMHVQPGGGVPDHMVFLVRAPYIDMLSTRDFEEPEEGDPEFWSKVQRYYVFTPSVLEYFTDCKEPSWEGWFVSSLDGTFGQSSYDAMVAIHQAWEALTGHYENRMLDRVHHRLSLAEWVRDVHWEFVVVSGVYYIGVKMLGWEVLDRGKTWGEPPALSKPLPLPIPLLPILWPGGGLGVTGGGTGGTTGNWGGSSVHCGMDWELLTLDSEEVGLI